MPTYLAMLRGINVSGQKKIKMEDLRKLFTSLKFKNVRTYIQSGNVVFDSASKNPQKLAQQIKAAILKHYDFEVSIIIKQKAEMEHITANNPFINNGVEDIKYIAVTFLEEVPVKEHLETIDKEKYLPDEFIVLDKVIYLHCPNGFGRSKLHNNFFERKLKTVATTRNWRSVLKLTDMLLN